jgi:hypothetical protein
MSRFLDLINGKPESPTPVAIPTPTPVAAPTPAPVAKVVVEKPKVEKVKTVSNEN